MQVVTKYLLTTTNSPDGFIYSYTKEGLFAGLEIKQLNLKFNQRQLLIQQLFIQEAEFLAWAKAFVGKAGNELVQLSDDITFEMFWAKYNDKIRSSRKRSFNIWNKLPTQERVKAFYYIDTYNRNRGNAEKKYCETYLNAELWNN